MINVYKHQVILSSFESIIYQCVFLWIYVTNKYLICSRSETLLKVNSYKLFEYNKGGIFFFPYFKIGHYHYDYRH